MNLFKHRQFEKEIIIWAVRWYCKYGISYRDLEEMLEERGVEIDHSTINRWVIFYAPKLAEKLKKYWKPKSNKKWGRATIAGFEVMRMFKKGQFEGVCSVREEVDLVTRSLSIF